jgi:hypothetical protein
MTIAAAFTDGDSDNLMVGRNGLFYDRKGRDWDATITKIIENPISIRQAFWAPYKKLVRLIEEQVAKRAAAADAAADAKIAAAATRLPTWTRSSRRSPRKSMSGRWPPWAWPSAPSAPSSRGSSVGSPGCWSCRSGMVPRVPRPAPGGLGPSMLIAWLKLRQRNLGPILDANGWAVNGRVRVPVSLGQSLTTVAKLPAGTLPATDDRFAEPPVFWPKLLLFAVVIGFIYSLLNTYGLIDKWTAGKLGTKADEVPALNLGTLLGQPSTNAPAATNAPPATNAPAAK